MVTQLGTNAQYTASRMIDQLLDPGARPRDRLGKLCRAMLAHQGTDVSALSNADAVSEVVSARQFGRDQRFFAATFLRLLSVAPKEIHDLENDRRVGVMKLLDKLSHVARALDVDRNAQGYERLRAFEPAAERAEALLSEALTPPRSLGALEHAQQRIMRVYQNPLVGAIAQPFFPDFLSKAAVSVIFDTVRSYMTAGPRSAMTKYNDAKETLEAVLDECTQYDTAFVAKFFRPFLARLLEEMTTAFEASSVVLPGLITLRDVGKKYPFAVLDAEVRIAFALENIGRGIAFDVDLSIEADDSLSLPSPSQHLEQVAPGETFEPVVFHATVKAPTEESVLVGYTLRWKNGDGSDRRSEDLIELPTQPSDIPWDQLEHAEPYSLEPVTKANELIGRSAQTRLLISKLKAQSVGSFCIYGQRRVGKTSVVATLSDMPEMAGTTNTQPRNRNVHRP